MKRDNVVTIVIFLSIVLITAFDIVYDISTGIDWKHIVAELILIVIATVGGTIMIRRSWLDLHRRMLVGNQNAARYQKEAETWRHEAQGLIKGLSAEIDRQFQEWQLSAAEQDVARLLIKGLSHKEIASVRGVAEKTIKQQSRAIYSKSRLSNRAELAAFFLEDLLDRPESLSKANPPLDSA